MATPEQLIPVLQSLIQTVNALIAALGGGGPGAPVANATSGAGALGAPSRTPVSGGGHGDAHGSGHGAGSVSHKGMRVIKRTTQVNEQLASDNFNAVYSSFHKHGRAGLDFKNNQTHGYISEPEKRDFRARFPGLPVPESIVFRAGSQTPIGVTYRTKDPNFDLGKGDRHDHTGDKGTSQMQHIWFTPGDPALAFSDIQHGMTGGMSAVMKKRGYPT